MPPNRSIIDLASFAAHPDASRGRLYSEPESDIRSPYQRDRDRIIHSAAFRRLKHKTQVFVAHEGDHFRTRLTHSLEVAQIARTISRVLGLNEDLAEALSLAHDLGHTPFGHAGEDALNAVMSDLGGFDHNAQTLRIVTRLERKYAAFDGLNLTWETLEGVVKHNGPVTEGRDGRPIPAPIVEYDREHDLELGSYAGPEAQVAALADDIAYNNHDIDDGLRAGLFAVDDLIAVPLVGPMIEQVRGLYPDLALPRLIHETVRRLIDHMVADLLAESRRRIADARVETVSDVRSLGRPVIAFSEDMVRIDEGLRGFLRERMYRHPKVDHMTTNARRVVRELFGALSDKPALLPEEWREQAAGASSERRARTIADYIAGMTDRFALKEHRQLFGTQS